MASLEDVKRISRHMSRRAVASKQLRGGTGISLSGGVVAIDADTSAQANSVKALTSGAVHTAVAGLTTEINGKVAEPSSFPIGDSNDRVLLVNASSKATSLQTSVTSTELGRLSGVSGALQTQIDGKLALSGGTVSGTLVAPTITCTSLNGKAITSQNGICLKGEVVAQLAGRIDTLGMSGTTSSGSNWSVRIPGGRTGANNWSRIGELPANTSTDGHAAKAYGQHPAGTGLMALGGDFDGATVSLDCKYDTRSRHGYFQSDDRCKHFEQTTENCIAKIMSLTPKSYVKGTELYDLSFVMEDDLSNKKPDDHFVYECGLIAQEVKKSGADNSFDELSFSVTGGDYVDDTGETVTNEFTLNYNNLFCLALGATKEQEVVIRDLKARIEILEAQLSQ
jgi:hypothetical protein